MYIFEIKCIYEYIYNIYIIYLNINMYKLSVSCYHTCAQVHEISQSHCGDKLEDTQCFHFLYI